MRKKNDNSYERGRWNQRYAQKKYILYSSKSYLFQVFHTCICNREVEVARVSGSILKKRVLQLSVSFGVSGTEVIE